MKTAVDPIEITSLGLGERTKYSMLMTAKSANILSSAIYKDKITAIMRELSANAYDAHIDAGIPDVPITVHLPSPLEPYFSVLDRGKGISPEDIKTVYTVYFCSTKDMSNDQLGGLGLGCKAPFSLVDAFTVISRFQGEQRIYDMFKNEDGIPDSAQRGPATVATEPDGVEVIVPISRTFNEFTWRAPSVYSFYDVVPTFIGTPVTPTKNETSMQGDGWALMKRSGGARVIMGVVAYPLGAAAFTHEGLDASEKERLGRILNSPFDIPLNIGDAEVAPSREELDYDRRTSRVVVALLRKISSEVEAKVRTKFAKCESLRAVKTLHNSLFAWGTPLAEILGTDYAVKWKGHIVTSSLFTIDMNDYPNTTLSLYADSPRGGRRTIVVYRADEEDEDEDEDVPSWKRKKTNNIYNLDATSRTQIFVNDAPTTNSLRIHHYRNSDKRVPCLLITTDVDSELDAIIAALDGFEFNNVSSLDRPPVNRSKASVSRMVDWVKTGNIEIKGVHIARNDRARRHWDPHVVELETGGVFIPTRRHEMLQDNEPTEHFAKYYNAGMKLGLFNRTEEIYAIPQTLIKKFKNNENWVEFFDELSSRFDGVFTEEVQYQICGRKAIDGLRTIPRIGDIAAELATDHLIRDFFTDFTKLESELTLDVAPYVALADLLGVEAVSARWAAHPDMRGKSDAITKAYPLLRFVAPKSEIPISDIVDYVVAIDRNAAR